MINDQTLNEILKSPANDKIDLVLKILDSLKSDISHESINKKTSRFKIRKISLGQELKVDRDDLYADGEL